MIWHCRPVLRGTIPIKILDLMFNFCRNCEWTISAPQGQQIKLNVTTFDLENHTHCAYDFLEIRWDWVFDHVEINFGQLHSIVRNGGSSSSPLFDKYCGRVIPPTITSFGNQIYLRYSQDLVPSDIFCTDKSSQPRFHSDESAYDDEFHIKIFLWIPDYFDQNILHGHMIKTQVSFWWLGLCSWIPDLLGLYIHGVKNLLWPSRRLILCIEPLPHPDEHKVEFGRRKNPGAFFIGHMMCRCGGELSSPTGSITSPNYPQPYHHQVNLASGDQ